MSYNQFDNEYEDFLASIALTFSQASRIDSSLASLSELFLTAFNDATIYTQGSFATNTTVKPLTESQSKTGVAGEYDVDIVIERETWDGAQASLEAIRTAIEEDDKYAQLMLPSVKESCERIEYASEESGVGFHVDLVPIKNTAGNLQVAIRTPDGWRDSDPKAIIEWFNNLANENPFAPAIVMTIKRMRDYYGIADKLPSIMVIALVGSLYSNRGSYVDDLLDCLYKIAVVLQQPNPNINIPVNDENLANKWSGNDQREVFKFFSSSYSNLKTGFDNSDFDEVREVLSDDFPRVKYDARLSSFRSQGWSMTLDGSLSRPIIEADFNSEFINRRTRRRLKATRSGEPIVFKAFRKRLSADEYLQWQVMNDSLSKEVRGRFFDARKAPQQQDVDDFTNYETVKYPGTHWIRYVIINDDSDKVVTIAHKCTVEF